MKNHNYNPYNRELGFNEKHLNSDDLAVSKTNLEGNIEYANLTMLRIVDVKLKDIIGKKHNVSRHPDMPKSVFKMMWQTIKEGKDFYGYVKNLCRDGSFYWTFAFITPDFDKSGNIIGYHSERRAPNPKAIIEISTIYQNLKDKEALMDLDETVRWFEETILKDKSYHSYIHKLQNQL